MAHIREAFEDPTSTATIAFYLLAVIASILIGVLGYVYGNAAELILIFPVILILMVTITSERKRIHIPPALVILLLISFYLSVAGRVFAAGAAWERISGMVTGISLALLGIISVYLLLKSKPGVRKENPVLVAMFSIAIAISIYTVMAIVQYYLSTFDERLGPPLLEKFVLESLWLMVGAGIISALYIWKPTRKFFDFTVNSFIEKNAKILQLEGMERDEVLTMISDGESVTTEFKSTLRTNLQTNEVDKRMEIAVLKSIVALMNSEGGTLLIGVDDQGVRLGLDLDGFESQDKYNLHLTHLISSKIGDDFLPYITFKPIEFEDGKSVMKVDCQKVTTQPVFLKDKSQEIFYVRSGPSSVELTGTKLLSYVSNREGKRKLLKR
ncbi:MAG: ATP-binding protein [Candidatus Methanomethylophilaceae archaeon]|nr:ATP-binding protein [Candidatus Methanomethylophilaceae archaeon]